MIPIIDLLIKRYIDEGLERLKNEPERIRHYFGFASPKTIEDMVKFVTQYKISVLTGYPREPSTLPCVVITIAGEDEVSHGIGDGIDMNYPEWDEGRQNYLHWTNENDSKYIRESAQLRAQIRAEVWTDNAVTTSFLYAIVKYCLFSAKWDMRKQGIFLPQVSGGDLEPVPDYMTIFVYRKAALLNFEYELNYHVGDKIIGQEDDHFALGTAIDDISINWDDYKEGE